MPNAHGELSNSKLCAEHHKNTARSPVPAWEKVVEAGTGAARHHKSKLGANSPSELFAIL